MVAAMRQTETQLTQDHASRIAAGFKIQSRQIFVSYENVLKIYLRPLSAHSLHLVMHKMSICNKPVTCIKYVGSQFSDFFKTPVKKSEKGTVLLIDNQQFSNFLE